MDPNERSMQMRLASHQSWANTPDRAARTANARKARQERFITQAREMHPGATDEQIAQVADSLRSAHYTALALRSAKARRLKRDAAKESQRQQIEAAITADAGGDAVA